LAERLPARAKELRDVQREFDAQTSLPWASAGEEYVSQTPLVSDNATRLFLLGALGLILVGSALSLSRYLRRRSLTRALPPPRPSGAAPGKKDRRGLGASLAEIEENGLDLARQGRYPEAIHALLLQTFRELSQRFVGRAPRSLTSRETIPALALAAPEESALRDLVARVEISYFGTHEPQKADFELARASFLALKKALRLGDS
jgi:hypothetical protein